MTYYKIKKEVDNMSKVNKCCATCKYSFITDETPKSKVDCSKLERTGFWYLHLCDEYEYKGD